MLLVELLLALADTMCLQLLLDLMLYLDLHLLLYLELDLLLELNLNLVLDLGLDLGLNLALDHFVYSRMEFFLKLPGHVLLELYLLLHLALELLFGERANFVVERFEPDQAVLVVLHHVLMLVLILRQFLAKRQIDLLELLFDLDEELLKNGLN